MAHLKAYAGDGTWETVSANVSEAEGRSLAREIHGGADHRLLSLVEYVLRDGREVEVELAWCCGGGL